MKNLINHELEPSASDDVSDNESDKQTVSDNESDTRIFCWNLKQYFNNNKNLIMHH